MKNIFQPEVVEELIHRINSLSPHSTPRWGIMRVDQMMAHCNVAYEMAFDDSYPKQNWLMRFILKTFIKKKVTGETPYPKNSRTSPNFIIMERRNFEIEKATLIQNLEKARDIGTSFFEGRDSPSFGKMTSKEWNGLFYKHLDHHLMQFGA